MRRPRAAWLASALVAGAGCVSVSRPYPDREAYGLGTEDPVALADAPALGTLRIDAVHVAAPFDGSSFVYRTGELAYTIDDYRGLVARPAALLEAETVRFLDAARFARTVVDGRAPLDATHEVSISVLELAGDYRDPDRPRAFARARFVLVADPEGERRLAGDWTEEAAVPLTGRGGGALARALGLAWDRVLAALVRDASAASQ